MKEQTEKKHEIMTELQQRISIAELCGWLPDDDGSGCGWRDSFLRGRLIGKKPIQFDENGEVFGRLIEQPVPDYLNDLNAMHDAEKHIKDFQKYVKTLAKVILGCGKSCRASGTIVNVATSILIRATARHRAEAFLRTLNKWNQ